MWNRVLLLTLAFGFVRTYSFSKPSPSSNANIFEKSSSVEDIDYIDEALKRISREVEFSFSDEEDASWFIEPTTCLSPFSVNAAAQTPFDDSNPRKRMKTENSSLSSATIIWPPTSGLAAKSSLSIASTPTGGISPLFSSKKTRTPSTAASFPEKSPLKTENFTLKAPPKPNLLELDLAVDVPVIEAWLLYKYRLVSGDHLATAVDYGRLHIRGWPFQVPIIRSKWNILQVMYLKEAVVGEVEFEFTGKSTIDLEKNSRLEMKLKLALNVPESEPLDWNTVRPYMWKFLTSTESAHWNEQDRRRVIGIINTVNQMRNVLKKKAAESHD